MKKNKKVNPVNVANMQPETPLHDYFRNTLVSTVESVRQILMNGLDVNLKDKWGMTALHVYLKEPNPQQAIIKFLLDQKSQVNAEDQKNKTPFHYYLKQSRPLEENMTILLNSQANINAKDSQGKTPLYGYLDSACPKKEGLSFLIKNGADINIQDNCKETPLNYYLNKQSPDIEIALYLIENNANVDIKDKDGNTCLHNYLSRKKPDFDICELLIKNTSNINEKNNKGKTYLHGYYKLKYNTKNRKILNLLIDQGANINATDNEGKTPIYFHNYCSVEGKRFDSVGNLETLIEYGADINHRDNKGKTPIFSCLHYRNIFNFWTCFLQKSANINALDNLGKTIIYYFLDANGVDNSSSLDFLMRKKVNLNIRSLQGELPLSKTMNTRSKKLNGSVVKKFLKHGANFNLPDNEGRTLFHHYLMKTEGYGTAPVKKEILNVILENSNINLKDYQDKTPIDYYCASHALHNSPSTKEIFILLLNSIDPRTFYSSYTMLDILLNGHSFFYSEVKQWLEDYYHEHKPSNHIPINKQAFHACLFMKNCLAYNKEDKIPESYKNIKDYEAIEWFKNTKNNGIPEWLQDIKKEEMPAWFKSFDRDKSLYEKICRDLETTICFIKGKELTLREFLQENDVFRLQKYQNNIKNNKIGQKSCGDWFLFYIGSRPLGKIFKEKFTAVEESSKKLEAILKIKNIFGILVAEEILERISMYLTDPDRDNLIAAEQEAVEEKRLANAMNFMTSDSECISTSMTKTDNVQSNSVMLGLIGQTRYPL